MRQKRDMKKGKNSNYGNKKPANNDKKTAKNKKPMKRSDKLMALCCILLGVVCAILLINWLSNDGGNTGDTPIVVYSPTEESITKIEWTYNKNTYAFDRSGEQWTYAADAAFPADSVAFSKLLKALGNVTATKSFKGQSDLAEYGLAEPVCTVKVTADGQETTLSFGTASPNDENLYYLSTGGKNVYMITPTLLQTFCMDLNGVMDHEDLPDFSKMEKLTIKTSNHELELQHIPNSGYTYSDLYSWFHGKDPMDPDMMSELISQFREMSWKSFATYTADEAQLKTYGLDKPHATFTVTLPDSTFVIDVGEADGNYYVRAAGSKLVYHADKAAVNYVCAASAEGMRPDEVIYLDWSPVTKFDLTIDGTLYSVKRNIVPQTTSSGGSYVTIEYDMNGTAIQGGFVLDAIDAMTSNDFVQTGMKKGKELVALTVYRNAEHGGDVTLSIYEYSSDLCIVTLNGEDTVLVTIDTVDVFRDTALSYLS